MISNLNQLAELVDLSRIDRKLADKIEAELDSIKRDIEQRGYSDVMVGGHTLRVTTKT
jgi:hypothetical protein